MYMYNDQAHTYIYMYCVENVLQIPSLKPAIAPVWIQVATSLPIDEKTLTRSPRSTLIRQWLKTEKQSGNEQIDKDCVRQRKLLIPKK